MKDEETIIKQQKTYLKSLGHISCPFCRRKIKSIEECPHCRKSLNLKDVKIVSFLVPKDFDNFQLLAAKPPKKKKTPDELRKYNREYMRKHRELQKSLLKGRQNHP